MQLPGRLSSSTSTLGDLLGALHREGTTGLLELREIRGPLGRSVPGRVHRIHLRGGLVAAVETALPVPPLGEILRREGLAPASAVARLVAHIQSGDRRAAGEILAASGLASPQAIRAALTQQLRERLEALFGIDEATIAFYTARPLTHVVRVTPLGPGEFLHGRPRSRDRQRAGAAPRAASARPSPGPAPRPATSGIRDDAEEHARRLLGLPTGAATPDVRRAFRRLASALHPDRLMAASAEEQRRQSARFAELSAAYHLLVA